MVLPLKDFLEVALQSLSRCSNCLSYQVISLICTQESLLYSYSHFSFPVEYWTGKSEDRIDTPIAPYAH